MAEAKFKEETLNAVFSQVQGMIEVGMLLVPQDYSVENALRHAWFKIQETKGGQNANYRPALEICTMESVALSLLKMVTDGLTPAKSQCGFVVRKVGDKFELNYIQEYQGKIALAKRYSGVKRVDSQVVYEGEEYKAFVKDGIKSVEHKPDMDFIDFAKIKGAYCVVTEADGTKQTYEMSWKQIQTAWSKGAMKGEGDVHKEFADQMCMKTVINRACKPYINSSNDSVLVDNKPKQLEEKKALEIKPNEKKPISQPAKQLEEANQPDGKEKNKQFEAGF